MPTHSLLTFPQNNTPQEMEDVNRLGWKYGRLYTAYGLRFGLCSNDTGMLELAAPHLPLGWQPKPEGNTASSADSEVDFLYSLHLAAPAKRKGARSVPAGNVEGVHLLYCNSTLLSRTMELPNLLATIEQHSKLLTAFSAQDYLFVHAGVVGWQGRAILIPGRSMSGKSTLVRALLDAGAKYYSDEYAILDGEGNVHPYPVPISIREGNKLVGNKYSLETLGIQPGTEPLPVALVVVAKYKRYARWQPETLTPSQAMLALMDNTVGARREPTFTMPILKQVAMSATTIASKRGEAKKIVPAILQQLKEEADFSAKDCKSRGFVTP